MMKDNIHYMLFSCKKIMQRLTILARHRKGSQDANRGFDIFRKVSTKDEENRHYSAMFL